VDERTAVAHSEAVIGCGREEASGHGAAPRDVYRLRDLSRGGRWLALAFALALSLPAVLAFNWAVNDWAPSGDAALMGIRALDVGTSRTPLVGQPSTGGKYIGDDDHVNHPGPLHFYLLAVGIRSFGGSLGMLVVSVLIVWVCVQLAAWAVFRELGAAAGIVAAVLLGVVMFTTGTSSLVDPVSSRAAGYPLLCASVLCWCVLCGDLRLLPLATAMVSFAAEQHLAVAPAVAVLAAAAVVGVIVALVRRPREVAWWCWWSVLVALVLWAPVLLDQVINPNGNLGRILHFAGSSHRKTLGATSALRQLANALGLPPLLGRMQLTGGMMLAPPSSLTWISAAVALAIVAALGLRWRTRNPRQATLAVMVGITALAGFANGSSVPVGFLEESRIAFYHWTFVLAFFTWLVLGLGVLEPMRAQLVGRPRLAHGLTALALAAIILPAAINPTLDRPSNYLESASSFLPRRYLRRIGDAVFALQALLGKQAVLIGRGGEFYAGQPQALAFELAARGLDVRAPLALRGFVHDDRMVDPSTVDTGLVLIGDAAKPANTAPRGILLADVDLRNRPDPRAFEELVAQAQTGGEVRLGPAAAEALAAMSDPFQHLSVSVSLADIAQRPRKVLTARVLRFLRDHPIEEPRLDPALIDRVLAGVRGNWSPASTTRLRLYSVDRAELLRVSPELRF
jgi:hypothetical protein